MPPALPPIPRIASVYERPQEQQERPAQGQERVAHGQAQGLGLAMRMEMGLGAGPSHPELQRAKTTESFDSQSSGSPILGDQVFSPPRQEQWTGQSQERARDIRSPPSAGDGHYRSPSGQLTSPPVRSGAGYSESEFKAILQGKHLPPVPQRDAPRRPSEISPPPMSVIDESHQMYGRQPVMSLGNQSKQSLAPSTMTRASDRTGKTKTRLLNPMSLLLRRRNGQTLDHLAEESLVSRRENMISPGLPDNFDPSIRGNRVHDFSAPRPRRNVSDQNMQELAERERRESSSREGQHKPRNMSEDMRHTQHTPVFKEHFEDDGQKADSALRAENLANKDFVARNSLPLDEAIYAPPPFARGGQKTVYKPPVEHPAVPSPPPPPVPAKDTAEDSTLLVAPPRQQQPLSPLMEDPVSPDPDATPRSKRTSNASTMRQSTVKSIRTPASMRSSGIPSRMNSAASANGLPAHMFSRASRFSFQYASGDSAAQERILEENYRAKAAKARAEKRESGESYADEDDFDYDDMDMDAMDDDVPMNGEDWDYGGTGGGLGIGNMTLGDMRGPTHGGLGNMSLDDFEGNGMDDDYGDDFGSGGLGGMTLDDMPGGGRGLGHMTLDSLGSKPAASVAPSNPLRDNPAVEDPTTAGAQAPPQGLGIDTTSQDQHLKVEDKRSSSALSNNSSTSIRRKPVGSGTGSIVESKNVESGAPAADQDDFYFDNGEFDGEFADDELLAEINGDGEGQDAFDESVFDDPSHPLYERKQPTAGPAPPIPRMSSKRTHNTLRGRKPRSRPPSDPLPEHPDPGAPSHQVEAYQSALAMFATKAAAAGRFERKNSVASDASSPLSYQGGPVRMGSINEKPPPIGEQPELTPDVARLSQESSTLSPPTARASGGNELDSLSKSVGFMLPGHNAGFDDSYASDFDYSDYDSTFEDDPMIAAANAEALENDDEGLYGSEFGFYARPGASESDTGENGSMYGGYFGPKNWGEIKRQRSTREPNLTPITERSEYSTRNSFIGLGFAEHERGQSSPALAQLARMSSPSWEGDLSMEALMKLRRAQWGEKSSPRGSPSNTSPVVAGQTSQQHAPVWSSSPMSRSMFSPGEEIPEADADDEYDEEMLQEANFDDDEEDYDEEETQRWIGGELEEDVDEDETQVVSPLDESPASESPTIRAHALPQSHSPSVSPMKLGPPFTFPAPAADGSNTQQGSLVSPISTSSPSTTLMSGTANTTPLVTHSQRSSAVLVSPISPSVGGSGHHKPGHSRSGSDSVSYSRERDEEKGEFRWVLERRRTAEDGAEFVERTPVDGGRI